MSWGEGHGIENVSGGSAWRSSGGVHTSNKRDVKRGWAGHGRGLGHQGGVRGGQREAGGGRGVGRVRGRGAQGAGTQHVITGGGGGGLVRQRPV